KARCGAPRLFIQANDFVVLAPYKPMSHPPRRTRHGAPKRSAREMLYPESVAEESKHSITRRRFLQLSGLGAAGLLVYSGEFERHHLQITQRTIELKRLAPALDGLRIAQISD